MSPWSSGDSLSPSILNLRQGAATLPTGFSTNSLQAESGSSVNIFSDVSTGLLAASKAIQVGGLPNSTSGLLSLRANSLQSDYIFLQDSTGLKSNFLLGLRTGDGSSADGLNLYDMSHTTLLVRFSSDSIKFFKPVVGPVFDSGGALASTYNAAIYGVGLSKESQIQAAITAALVDNVKRVYVPASMYPYNAPAISFSTRVQMVREGGNWSVYDITAYGASGDGVTDDTFAMQSALNGAGANNGIVTLEAKTYVISSSVDPFAYAGQSLVGSSGYQTIIKAKSGFSGTYVLGLANPTGGTSAYNSVRHLRINLNNQAITGVTLASVNNSVVEEVLVEGGTNFATRIGTGFQFAAPLASGAYSNTLQNCRARYCTTGVLWSQGANQNIMIAGACESNTIGLDAAPGGSGVDTAKALYTRLEANNTGIKEGGTGNVWIGLRFEANVLSDFEYTSASVRPSVFACLHSSSSVGGSQFNLSLASYPQILDSNSRVYTFAGGGIIGLGDTTYIGSDPSVALTGVSGEKLVVTGGRIYLGNNQWLCHRNAANNGTIFTILVDATNNIQIGSTSDVLVPKALTIGGGFHESGITIARFENTFTNLPSNSTGAGVEIGISSGSGLYQTYNRTGATYITALYDALNHRFRQGPVILENPLRVLSGTALAPAMAYSSEVSLGWYNSGTSTMALSYGSLNLNQSRLVSIRTTGTSLSSTQLNVSEAAFFIGGASGATLGLRVNGIVYLFNSSSTTIG